MPSLKNKKPAKPKRFKPIPAHVVAMVLEDHKNKARRIIEAIASEFDIAIEFR